MQLKAMIDGDGDGGGAHVPQRSALADLESSMGGGFGDAFDSLSATMGR